MTRARSAASVGHQSAHLLQVCRLLDHELQLIIISRHQFRQDSRLDPQPFVLRAQSGPSGVELASLGLMLIRSQATGAKTVPAVSIVMCSPARAAARSAAEISGAIIGSPPVTTTCRAGCAAHFVQDLVQVEIHPLRLPRSVRRIAPGAAQIAAAGADENRRHAHQRPLALNRVEQLSDLQCPPLRIPCAAAGRHRTGRTAGRPASGS